MGLFNEKLECLDCGKPTKSRDNNNNPLCSDCKEKREFEDARFFIPKFCKKIIVKKCEGGYFLEIKSSLILLPSKNISPRMRPYQSNTEQRTSTILFTKCPLSNF